MVEGDMEEEEAMEAMVEDIQVAMEDMVEVVLSPTPRHHLVLVVVMVGLVMASLSHSTTFKPEVFILKNLNLWVILILWRPLNIVMTTLENVILIESTIYKPDIRRSNLNPDPEVKVTALAPRSLNKETKFASAPSPCLYAAKDTSLRTPLKNMLTSSV
uniref:Uncharacterized protein n=1 Tax=Cacopsylla melanoneura TaxID=428564 RepID=A0A8D8XA29_9HEMI